jgi:hypothetical protein
MFNFWRSAAITVLLVQVAAKGLKCLRGVCHWHEQREPARPQDEPDRAETLPVASASLRRC